jgi:hypothetical protein
LKKRFKNPIVVNSPQSPLVFATDLHGLNETTSRSNQAHAPRQSNSSTRFFTASLLVFRSVANSGVEVNWFAGKTVQVVITGKKVWSTQNFWTIEESATDDGKKSRCDEYTGSDCHWT